ncbi:tryptophan dimethylallyltransferase fgaPT2 [Aspergillus fumigatus Af293]|uniref:Tryptophan dimethylallyltransferase n=1 Tax=Aspergillus fumigatus (strain CBS 144.89 / FGSC A1163 / CEA10) TaxID=451804 RepID=B0XW14_ASPFC|nr:dimethylallyl tryptophan synthase FgaPT2 [Aspergillus fumigatus Af293]EAL94103.2 dimethylallyl tryptophan synthase FgaPT2 [Aspergillus fumigatus Af293]EDP55307.1 tryptophan dimethylallyltransferase FgaPT2 [Aspergillus fumigatus A1163]
MKAANASSAEAYRVLSRAFRFDNEDQKLWWHSTAPMFAKMLETANYTTPCQYQYLITYKECVIPSLGCYPTNSAPRWLSILTRYGTPFELSLNCSNSIVRYTFEPINQHTGTDKDPFNTHAIWESLQHLLPLEKSIDLEWFRHFKHDLTLNSEESAFLAHNDRLVGGTIRTQNKLALDLKDGRFALKTYIYPALKAVVTGKTIHELVFGSVRRLAVREPRILPPLNMLEEYIRSRGSKSTASPRLVSCDLTSPAKSRIKIYLLEQMVSLEAMEDLWTLGGRRRDASTLEGLSLVRELWDLIQLSPGLKSYPAPYLPLGVIPDERLPLMANFTLHQNDPVPEPQVYFTTFGMNDMAVADALTTFFERRGWSEMARTYETTLKSYYPHADHDKLNYLHAYISFSYRDRTPYLSVYLQSFETGDWAVKCQDAACQPTSLPPDLSKTGVYYSGLH